VFAHLLHHFDYILGKSSNIEGWLLPRKGYKCLTINEQLHETIKKRAKETNQTIRDYVEYLLAKEKVNKEKK